MSAFLLPIALILADTSEPAPLAPPALTGQTASPAVAPVADPETTAVDASAVPASTPASDSDPVDDTTAIVVTARPKADPLESVNTFSYNTIQVVDHAFTRPAAMAYKHTLPTPVRSGLRNFFNNLHEPIVFLNFVLQLKPGKALETLARFSINTTLGAGGLVDIARRKPFHLQRRPNGFAWTLGYYGVHPGAYLFLPLIGPTTVRDFFGRAIDLAILPTVVGSPFNNPVYSALSTSSKALDERVETDEEITRIRMAETNPYAAIRREYLENRQAEIDALHTRRQRSQHSTSQ